MVVRKRGAAGAVGVSGIRIVNDNRIPTLICEPTKVVVSVGFGGDLALRMRIS